MKSIFYFYFLRYWNKCLELLPFGFICSLTTILFSAVVLAHHFCSPLLLFLSWLPNNNYVAALFCWKNTDENRPVWGVFIYLFQVLWQSSAKHLCIQIKSGISSAKQRMLCNCHCLLAKEMRRVDHCCRCVHCINVFCFILWFLYFFPVFLFSCIFLHFVDFHPLCPWLGHPE